jgi:S-formylglutathione hydrolase FrmB
MPVVEVFTGYPGSTQALVDRLDYPSHLLAALRAGAAQSMTLVMLRPSVTYPRDTECTNVPHGPRAFDYFAADVPAVVSQTFGLRATGYATIGDSTGGMCATKLAVIDPQRFTVAASLSGYYRAITDFTTGDLYGGSRKVRDENDIMWRLEHLPPPRISLLVGTALTEGGADGYRSAQRLLALVRPPMSAEEIVLSHGGHNFATWNLEIPRALVWISRRLG